MASYTITKKLAEASITAEQINAHHKATTGRSAIVIECADGTFVNGLRDMETVERYLATLATPAPAVAATPAPTTAAPATPRQIDYIMSLLRQRAATGNSAGFMTGPTTREGVARLTRSQASTYITSLTEQY